MKAQAGKKPRSRRRIRRSADLVVTLAALYLVVMGFQNCGRFEMTEASSGSSTALQGVNGETFTSVSPSHLYEGGGPLKIEGSGFSNSTTIDVGGQPCASIQLVTPTELICMAPALAGGGPKSLNVAGMRLSGALTYNSFERIISVAGRGVNGTVDGVGRLARLFEVRDMLIDGDTMYFVEATGTQDGTHTVRSLNLDTTEVKTIAGGLVGGFADGIGKAAKFHHPSGIVKKDRTLYIADAYNCMIRKVEIDTGEVTTIAGNKDECVVTDGVGAAIRFKLPYHLLLRGDDLYVSDKNSLRKLNLTTLTATTVAGGASLTMPSKKEWVLDPSTLNTEHILETAVETPHDYANSQTYTYQVKQPGAKAMKLHFTQFKTEDSADKATFTDANGKEIFVMSGDLGTDLWSGVVEGDTVNISFHSDSSIVDYGFKIDKVAYTSAESLQIIHTTDGSTTSAPIGSIDAMVSIGDTIYFIDGDLYMVRKLDLATSKVAGVTGQFDSNAAVRPPGKFNETYMRFPSGLTADSENLYVGDGDRARILKVNLATRFSTILFANDPDAGDAANIDGPLANASIFDPRTLVYDPSRGLYFHSHNVIRRIK